MALDLGDSDGHMAPHSQVGVKDGPEITVAHASKFKGHNNVLAQTTNNNIRRVDDMFVIDANMQAARPIQHEDQSKELSTSRRTHNTWDWAMHGCFSLDKRRIAKLGFVCIKGIVRIPKDPVDTMRSESPTLVGGGEYSTWV